MGNNRKLQFAIRAALAAAATSAAVPMAMAQTVAATNTAASANSTLEEVVVTGSRLTQSPNDVSISPINSITAREESVEYYGRESLFMHRMKTITFGSKKN